MVARTAEFQNSNVRVGLVGCNISASLTPAMHMAEGRAIGLNYEYNLVDMKSSTYRDFSLAEIMEQFQSQGYAGLNITHPFKVEVLQYLDGLSDGAKKIGAVNTVLFCGGRRIGYNTDFSGFQQSYNLTLGDAPKDRVLLLGAGGAGAAVGAALLEIGVRELIIFDALSARALDLVEKLCRNYPSAKIVCSSDLAKIVSVPLDGVVNTTPMGMKDSPGSALPFGLLSPKNWVADIVYFPSETSLLAYAKSLGCRVMPGVGMALWQAVDAFYLFTGRRANSKRMALVLSGLVENEWMI